MERNPIVLIAGAGLAAFLGFAGLSALDGRDAQAQLAAAEEIAEEPSAAFRPAASSKLITAEEANAWAEARAADTPAAYEVYLAAFPNGAFVDDARRAIARSGARPRPAATVRIADQPAPPPRAISEPRGPSRAEIASACQAYVDQTLSEPSQTARVLGGAAAGCAAGSLAGGNDRRNCALGAIVGATTGAVTTENRRARREQVYAACVDAGGPPG